MKKEVEAARAAYRLWNDETTIGTVAAIVLVVAFLGWPLFQAWRSSRTGGER
jgi:hypothetical protein